VQIAKNFWGATLTLLFYRLLVDLYRRRVSANILLLPLLRLYADGGGGGGGGGDVANQTAGYRKPDCPEQTCSCLAFGYRH